MKSSVPRNTLSNVLGTTGQMGERIRDFDWSSTALGPADTWPQSLQSALGICLNSNFPIAIYWGTDLVLLYNDAWSPIPGNKHPWALGKPALEVWPEIWGDIAPQFEKAFNGMPGGSRDALLQMQRHGYTEECYFDFTFTPIYGESGKVEGIFNAVIETTYRVINERRATVLQKLADAVNGVVAADDVLMRADAVLRDARQDVPFYTLYEFAAGMRPVFRAGMGGQGGALWPVDAVARGGAFLVDNISPYVKDLPPGYWPEPCSEAFIAPLRASDASVFGFIVCGVSPRRKFDQEYRSFFDSVAAVIGGELNTIRALNEEKERAESLAEIDRAKTAFFSNISHEFRTPLTLMLSPLQAVLEHEDQLSSDIKDHLATIYRNTLRLQKLVNTLLDFSRIEAGRVEPQFAKVDIAQLTGDLASSFRSAIENTGMAYEVDVQHISRSVYVDTDMWEKIVLNLISNAFKYTREGSIRVSLEEHDRDIVLTVADTGVGIADEEQERIFERFYRVNSAEGRSQEGTGIGLAMVRELVHLHNGDISLQSRYGRGTAFTVRIPLGSAHDTPSRETFSGTLREEGTIREAFVDEATRWSADTTLLQETSTESDNENPRVLIADDNADMRDYIGRLLAPDYNVKAVGNGEDAYTVAVRWLPDLIVSDVMMPRLDGFGLLRKLKENLVTRNIPVLFLSARAGEESTVEGIQAGADDYLVKPFSSRELMARVSNHILISSTRRRTEKEFYNLFLQSPVHIHMMKGPEHVVEFFHPLGKPFVGGKDITGMKMREAIPEVEGQGYFEMLDQVYAEGKSFFLPEAKASLTTEDGKTEDYYFNITYLPWRDLQGRIQGVLQFTFDVSQQAKANEKVRESEARFKVLANSIPQIVWIAGAAGEIEYISEQWTAYTGQQTGVTRNEFFGAVHPDDAMQVRARWEEALATRQAWSCEYRLRNGSAGGYNWFFGKSVPLMDNKGEVLKWIGSATDIQILKEQSTWLERQVEERTRELNVSNESLRRSNEELKQFAYIASHDLQEPLRKIQTFSGMATDRINDRESVARYLEKIDNSAARMSALIRDVLLYSQATRDTEERHERVQLDDVLDGVRMDFELLIAQKQATLVADPLPEVRGNRLQLHQLFSNLIGNALKFTERAPVIGIAVKRVTEDISGGVDSVTSEYHRIEFSDNGIGFDPAYSEQIFGLFNRLHNRKDYTGTGIGLALCKKIVENHHGAITATSVKGQGSTFVVYLPVQSD